MKIAPKQVAISEDGIRIEREGEAIVTGVLHLSEPLEPEVLSKAFKADIGGVKVDLALSDGSTSIPFSTETIYMGQDEKILNLKIQGEGLAERKPVKVTIPAEGPFRVLDIRRVPGPDTAVEVFFSEPLSSNAALKGLIELQGSQRQQVDIDANIARVTYESATINMQLLISGNVRSSGGSSLGGGYSTRLPSSEIKPAVEIPLKGNILPDRKQLLLPLKAVNLSAVDIKVIQIFEDNMPMFLQDNDLGGSSDIRRSGRLVYSRQLRLDGDPSRDLHQWNEYGIDLTDLFKREPGALYRIRVSFKQEYSLYGKDIIPQSLTTLSDGTPSEEESAVWDIPNTYYWDNFYDWSVYDWDESDNPDAPSYYMSDDRFPVVNLLSSSLGLLAKYADTGKVWVNVNDINTAKPASGVTVDIYSFQLQKIGSSKTGGDGMAEIPVSQRPYLLVARRGDETGYLKMESGSENSLSRFEVGGSVLNRGLKGFVYGERGVWRPGDTLHVTLIVADKTASLPQGHPAVMELYSPEGQFYTRQVAAGVDGFYTFHVPTASSDPTGYWNAYFKVGGTSIHKPLHIETVKPNRLKVELNPGASVLVGGTDQVFDIASSWLTGPPAGGLHARAEMTLSSATTAFKGFEGYVFRNPVVNFSSSECSLLDTRLNSEGKARVTVRLPQASDAPGMLNAFIVTSVEEEGGDESFTTQSIPFSPYSSYVGVKFPEGDYLSTDKAYTFSAAVVDPSGKRISGHNLEYLVYKLSWGWWWEYSSLEAYMSYNTPTQVASGRLTPGSSDASFQLKFDEKEWGRYLILVRDPQSGHTAGKVVTFDWPDYRGRADRRDPDALNMLSFSTDKRSYQVGESVTVYIPAAEGGQALVSLENGAGVLSREVVATNGSSDTQYSFKVTQEMAPNFYIHITLVQPYGNVGNDLPLRLYGVERILVENPQSHLEPQIKMADTVAPEEPFTVQVSEKSGKPMTYTLAIVDEGLLDITAFKTPDPWKSMYSTEALGVKTWDLYDEVIGAYAGRFSEMLGIGGDEAGVRGARKDNRFNPVVAFYGPFTLNKGTASHKVQLPMYVGSVRVMVVAGHAPAYGNAEKTVTVKSPLMILPTLPRVVADGETFTLPVNVFAMEDGIRSAKVSVEAEGPVKLEGATSENLAFEKAGDQMARFRMTTTGEGTAKITVTAAGAGHKAYETVYLQVQPANPETVKVTFQTLKKGKSATLRPQGSATLELAGFPALDAAGLFRQMKNYPYNCTEQIAARGLTMLNLLPMLSDEDAASANSFIPGFIQDLYARQAKDGGFVLWADSKTSDSWVSSMAGTFLTLASSKGFDVSKSVLKSWQNYQKNLSKAYRLAGNAAFSELDECYRLYSLALAGDAQSGAMNRMKEAPELSSRAKWMLADAYAVAGKQQVARELSSATDPEFEEYRSPLTFGSTLRDRAVALEVLTLTDQMGTALPMAQTIAEQFSGSYWCTQEAAFASMAMGRLWDKVGNQSVKAKVAGQMVDSPKSVVAIPVSGETVVENPSDGDLYLTLVDVFRAPAGTKVNAAASGLLLKVAYAGEGGAAVNPAKLRQGTEFTATVTVTNNGAENYTSLALTERIPSGWEIQNERLRGGSANNDGAIKDIRDDRCNWFFDLPRGATKRFTLKLRAAYEGEYNLPAITCEAMYDPHIAANTASGTASVTR